MTALATPTPQLNTLERLTSSVSASRLNCFHGCRLKFYFRYVLALPKPKRPTLHVGHTVHAVLASWHKARWLGVPLEVIAAAPPDREGNSDSRSQPRTSELSVPYFPESPNA